MCKDDILGLGHSGGGDRATSTVVAFRASTRPDIIQREEKRRPAIASQQFQGKLISADAAATMKQLHSMRETEQRGHCTPITMWSTAKPCQLYSSANINIAKISPCFKSIVLLKTPSRTLTCLRTQRKGWPRGGERESPYIQSS